MGISAIRMYIKTVLTTVFVSLYKHKIQHDSEKYDQNIDLLRLILTENQLIFGLFGYNRAVSQLDTLLKRILAVFVSRQDECVDFEYI